jgi:hypothetical protein
MRGANGGGRGLGGPLDPPLLITVFVFGSSKIHSANVKLLCINWNWILNAPHEHSQKRHTYVALQFHVVKDLETVTEFIKF